MIGLVSLGVGGAAGALAGALSFPSRFELQPLLDAALLGGGIATLICSTLAIEAAARAVRPPPWIALAAVLGGPSGLLPWFAIQGFSRLLG
jgi:hypothetical protein